MGLTPDTALPLPETPSSVFSILLRRSTCRTVQAVTENLAAADTTIYTVPTGKRFFIGFLTAVNTSGSNKTITPHLVPPSGSPAANNALPAATIGPDSPGVVTITQNLLPAGWSIVVAASATPGLNVTLMGYELDEAACAGFTLAYGESILASDTLLYTAPSDGQNRSLRLSLTYNQGVTGTAAIHLKIKRPGDASAIAVVSSGVANALAVNATGAGIILDPGTEVYGRMVTGTGGTGNGPVRSYLLMEVVP